jgi:hypothetical protein
VSTLQEKVDVMLAFSRGESIEARHTSGFDWAHCYNPNWDWVKYDYRIKQDGKIATC